MDRIQGKGVCGGVAIGKIRYLAERARDVSRRKAADPPAETERFEKARATALEELRGLYEKALRDVGEKEAAVFDIHQMMLDDEDYLDAIRNRIRDESVNAEFAVAETRDEFARSFAEMDDPYMQERAADVRDVSDRVLDRLSGKAAGRDLGDEPVIVAARDLSPSETIQLDKTKILAFVTAGGSSNSHTAILARTMGLPAVVAAGNALDAKVDGSMAAVDGTAGILYVDPDPETLKEMEAKKEKETERRDTLRMYRGKPNRTRDGHEILLYANIGSVSELEAVKDNDAGGIGLFRSEFLYLDSPGHPDEETQFAAYREVAAAMGGKRAIIRTLDIGADKKIGYFALPEEENPALGLRGIRLCLERPQVFRTQLRALYRASAFGKLAIMFPMIASPWELREAKGVVAEVKDELRREGRAFNERMEIGVMIETPAAAVVSDRLAAEVDFFSIGTNDLIQYTLAADRQNEGIERFCDPHHEAVLRLMETVVKNARPHGVWVGVCGELAGDLTLTETLLRMGVDELSVSPPRILELRKRIGECSLADNT